MVPFTTNDYILTCAPDVVKGRWADQHTEDLTKNCIIEMGRCVLYWLNFYPMKHCHQQEKRGHEARTLREIQVSLFPPACLEKSFSRCLGATIASPLLFNFGYIPSIDCKYTIEESRLVGKFSIGGGPLMNLPIYQKQRNHLSYTTVPAVLLSRVRLISRIRWNLPPHVSYNHSSFNVFNSVF